MYYCKARAFLTGIPREMGNGKFPSLGRGRNSAAFAGVLFSWVS